MTEHFNPFWANPYKWLWSRVNGRPFTYAWRDFYHGAPLVVILLVLAAGALIGNYAGLLTFLKWLGIGGAGILLGHLFWGQPWVPNQQELRDRIDELLAINEYHRKLNGELREKIDRLEICKKDGGVGDDRHI